MALVTETGTGSATAESYISVASADTYHSDRGSTAWAALTTAVKEQSLRKATEYMLQMYRNRWKGVRVFITQALDWPRSDVQIDPGNGPYAVYSNYVASNIVPVEVARACAEYALRASTAKLLDDLTQGVVSEQIGPISTTYDKFSSQSVRYPAVDAVLAPYLMAGWKVVRA